MTLADTAILERADLANLTGIQPVPYKDALAEEKSESVDSDKASLALAETVRSVKPARRSPVFTIWFLIAVVVPFILTWGYLTYLATPQYASSFRFVIQGSSGASGQANAENPDAASAGSSTSMSEIMVASFMIVDYITSPQMVSDLQADFDLQTMFSSPKIDWLSRLTSDASPEKLAKYWESRVTADLNLMNGLTTVTVFAFSPEEAHELASIVMRNSERLVNTIGERPIQDKLTFLKKQATIARSSLSQAREEIRAFRVEHQSIDPKAEASTTDAIVRMLTEKYVNVTTQLAVLRSQVNTNAPAISQLEQQGRALADEISKARQLVAHGSAALEGGGSGDSYAAQLQDFENLQLDLSIATTNYQAAEAALLSAGQQASQQHFYVLTYVLPAVALTSEYPDIPTFLLVAAFVLMAFWIMSTIIFHSIRDHM